MDLFTLLLEAFVALINIASYGMILAENWTGIIQTFASCTIAICAALGTRAAYKGLDAWRTEHEGIAKIDAAKKISIILHKISKFSTILSSVWVPLNLLKNPQETLQGATPQSMLATIRLDSFIDTIEDKNKFYELVTQADNLNKFLGRHTVDQRHHDSLSNFIKKKLSDYNELKEGVYSEILDASITIDEEIKPLYDELLRILDEIFDTYQRVLVILDPEKDETDKTIRHKIIFNTFPFKTLHYQRSGTQDSYASSLINAFDAQKNEVEKRAMAPLKASQTAAKLSWRRIWKRNSKKI
ncbi:hypothetical protein [uncultured Gilvimarinus sp.]|uniref:hypothetical protein n=1 Tax=uncultured Gilvimarinus sp. TaxID=1689143 RepID=UPI0030ECBB2D|tara:strand:- start:4526 stop:5422 length:897 start_codon:yes stop_codon:yes gene_type:complete